MHLILEDSFDHGLDHWIVEQQPDGRVYLEDGKLIIEDKGGCCVWYKEKIEAPVLIRYHVKASSKARVSDINCFWMASEPGHEDNLFYDGHQRTGAFATYDILQTYYVGMGGNYNSTTRFRRYEGGGKRPLLPEHDLVDPKYMIAPDHEYCIELVADGGKVQYYRDGELLFDYVDEHFLRVGWFAFRTVLSRIEVSDFQIFRLGANRH